MEKATNLVQLSCQKRKELIIERLFTILRAGLKQYVQAQGVHSS